METGETPPSPAEEMLSRVQVQIVVSRRYRVGVNWRFDLSSPFWRLYVLNRIGASIIFAGKRLVLRPSRLYLIPAWVRFQTSGVRVVEQDYIHFHMSGFPPSLQRRIFERPIELVKDVLLGGLCGRWRNGLLHRQGLAELGWTHAFVHAVLAAAVSQLPGERQELCLRWLADANDVRPALQCIEQRLSNPPSNPELAHLCHLSVDHFIRRFRQAIGITPARYSSERRLAVAAH
jgi:hypothetical protein